MSKAVLLRVAAIALLASSMYANSLHGVINAINPANHTIVVSGQMIQVLPNTKIELDDAGAFGGDRRGRFSDLRVNDMAKVKLMYNGNAKVPAAKKIEVQRGRGLAY